MKRAKIIGLSALVVLMGFFRDYLFSNINWVYKTITVNRMNQARKEFHFLLEWTESEILILKWILTILFYMIFFGLTIYTINLAFKNRKYNLITIGVFASIFGISGFLYVAGWISGTGDVLYGTIRTLMGMAQSFIPLMILGVIFRFNPELNR